MRGSSLPGSQIFKIAESGKVKFAEAVDLLPASEFENFKVLFALLSKLGLYKEALQPNGLSSDTVADAGHTVEHQGPA
jgi:hypothetical protein